MTASAAPPAASAVISVPVGRLAPESEAPTIDGRVDEAIWQTVEPQSGFVQQDPDEGAPATEKTEVRLLVGRGHVYVGIICFDSDPSRIIVSQARRDASLTDTDAIILVFDTFNDSQNGFVFGTNPLGIEYDGQVASEGQTGGLSFRSGQGGSQRGGISAFNPNWDGDWTVRAAITERGWEAELAIPLKTLRYETGPDRTWGFNVMRNIRRKNEQVYLSPIPRGFDIYRVSLAAKLTGLELPARRDIKLIPYALASVNKDYLLPSNQTDRDGAVGVDLKWGVKPNLTLDVTVNTDFAQVEADEEQVNLTRFDLFFPEKRPFFLENASTFQLGQPQQIDLFFSRRIGLSGTGASGQPIDIIAGSRLSGKLGPWNVGMLDIQTDVAKDLAGRLIAPANNFATVRMQREVGRSNFGGIFVNRQATGKHAGVDNWNRAYGLDANLQITSNSRVFAFLAGTTSPDTATTQAAGTTGTDYSGRIFYDFRNDLWQVSGGYAQVGERFNPEVGFLPRRGYRRPELRLFYQPQPKRWPWIRRISPHFNYSAYHDLDGDLQSSTAHIHFFEIQPAHGGRFGTFVDVNRDNPLAPFPVYNTGGRRVVIPAGHYTWKQLANEYIHDPSAVISGQIRHRVGGFYDGDYNAIELQGNVRVGSRFIGSAGWTRQNVDLSYGKFSTDLVPVRASYSFTTLASLSALLQYNSQSSQMSSNIRLALLNRSGTGLFVVYNDRRDTTRFTPYETVGRSFIVKYTRLVDF